MTRSRLHGPHSANGPASSASTSSRKGVQAKEKDINPSRLLSEGPKNAPIGRSAPRTKELSVANEKRGTQISGASEPLKDFFLSDTLEFGRCQIMDPQAAYREYCGIQEGVKLLRHDGRWAEFIFHFVS